MSKQILATLTEISLHISKWGYYEYSDLSTLSLKDLRFIKFEPIIKNIIEKAKSKFKNELETAYNTYDDRVDLLDDAIIDISEKLEILNDEKIDHNKLLEDINEYTDFLFKYVVPIMKALWKIYADENKLDVYEIENYQGMSLLYDFIVGKIKELEDLKEDNN